MLLGTSRSLVELPDLRREEVIDTRVHIPHTTRRRKLKRKRIEGKGSG
jgi:hypothetical protein